MAPEPGIFSLDRVETAKYIYLADGTKIGVSLPDGSETMYRGPFILHRDADSDVELQTLILPEGIKSDVKANIAIVHKNKEFVEQTDFIDSADSLETED